LAEQGINGDKENTGDKTIQNSRIANRDKEDKGDKINITLPPLHPTGSRAKPVYTLPHHPTSTHIPSINKAL